MSNRRSYQRGGARAPAPHLTKAQQVAFYNTMWGSDLRRLTIVNGEIKVITEDVVSDDLDDFTNSWLEITDQRILPGAMAQQLDDLVKEYGYEYDTEDHDYVSLTHMIFAAIHNEL